MEVVPVATSSRLHKEKRKWVKSMHLMTGVPTLSP